MRVKATHVHSQVGDSIFFSSSYPPKDVRATGQIALSQHLVTTQDLSALNCAPTHVFVATHAHGFFGSSKPYRCGTATCESAFLAKGRRDQEGRLRQVVIEVNGSVFHLPLDN